jgi:hypothetical protein
MTRQREERRWLSAALDSDRGVGLRPGDLIQAHAGGEIREVVAAWSAGECMEAAANKRAQEARETDNKERRHGNAD